MDEAAEDDMLSADEAKLLCERVEMMQVDSYN
jgi:hypothetical protein